MGTLFDRIQAGWVYYIISELEVGAIYFGGATMTVTKSKQCTQIFLRNNKFITLARRREGIVGFRLIFYHPGLCLVVK